MKRSLSIAITDDSLSENLSLTGPLSDSNLESFRNSGKTISDQSIKQE